MPATLERRRSNVVPWTGVERRQSTDRRPQHRQLRDTAELPRPLDLDEVSTLEGRSKPARGIAIAVLASGCMYSMLWLAAGAIFG